MSSVLTSLFKKKKHHIAGRWRLSYNCRPNWLGHFVLSGIFHVSTSSEQTLPFIIRACLLWWPLTESKNINLYRPAFWGLLTEFNSIFINSFGQKAAPVRCGSVQDCILNVLYLSWRQQLQSGQLVWASQGNITRLQKRQFGPCVGSCKPKLAENKFAMAYHQTSTRKTKSSSMPALSKLLAVKLNENPSLG